MASSTLLLAQSTKTLGSKSRASLNMEPGNPNAPVTISVTTRQRVGRGSWKNVQTTYTQDTSSGLFKDSSGGNWSGESPGSGMTKSQGSEIREAMGKMINNANVQDSTIDEWGSRQLGANKKDNTGGGDTSGGTDAGDVLTTIADAVQSFTPPRRMSYGNLRYPDAKLPDDTDFMKITMLKYKPGQFQRGRGGRASERQMEPLGNVILPIPPGLVDANSVGWGQHSMNNLQMAGVDAARNVMNAGGGLGDFAGAVANETKGLLAQAQAEAQGIGGLAKMALVGQIPGINASTNELLGRQEGKVLNPNMELLFQGPALRSFSYSFRLTARNSKEANTIKSIIRFFKQGMSVKESGGSGLFLDAPNVFDVCFHNGMGAQHKFIHKLKRCAMPNFAVNYVPDGSYMTLPNSAMTAYEISMSFQEMDPIFDSDYGSSDEIGY